MRIEWRKFEVQPIDPETHAAAGGRAFDTARWEERPLYELVGFTRGHRSGWVGQSIEIGDDPAVLATHGAAFLRFGS